MKVYVHIGHTYIEVGNGASTFWESIHAYIHTFRLLHVRTYLHIQRRTQFNSLLVQTMIHETMIQERMVKGEHKYIKAIGVSYTVTFEKTVCGLVG